MVLPKVIKQKRGLLPSYSSARLKVHPLKANFVAQYMLRPRIGIVPVPEPMFNTIDCLLLVRKGNNPCVNKKAP